MPISLVVRFPAGRYHATPYGHHVNEGLIEWPPSPWRVLRALISVGYTSGAWSSAGPPTTPRSLIEKLSAELPHYQVPPAVGAHSRHYMPVSVLNSKTKIENTTLVFDTWARVENQELTITWVNTHLDEDELSTLGVLVEHLNYLGRSESWAEGRIVETHEVTPPSNCFPEQRGETPGRGWEQIAILAPIAASDFMAWRNKRLEEARAGLASPVGRNPSKALLAKRFRAEEPYPVDLLDCLQKDTTWWRLHGWSQPPGSRRVVYWRRTDAIEVGAPKATRKSQSVEPVEAMLLSLTNASCNDHALPPVTRTLPQAELLHKALIGIAAKNGVPPSVLTGCDDEGKPLRGAHEHAHINPLDLDEDGHLDHVLIWAPMGLNKGAQAAIRAVRKTFPKGGVEPLRLALAASGDLTHLIHLPEPYGRHLKQIVAIDTAMVWQSLTPFVPPRFIKLRGKNTLEGQVRAELRSRGLPEPVSVHQLAPAPRSVGIVSLQQPATGDIPKDHDMARARLRHFIVSRRSGPQPPVQYGFAVRIEFDQSIGNRLVSLGYGSHFGMGLFRCEDKPT